MNRLSSSSRLPIATIDLEADVNHVDRRAFDGGTVSRPLTVAFQLWNASSDSRWGISIANFSRPFS